MSNQLNFLVALATCIGSMEAIRQTQAKTRRQEHRSRRNNLIVHCTKSSQYSGMLEGRHVVLSGEKLYIDTGTDHDIPFGFPFAGYYLPYPDSQFEGLVTAISEQEPPMMNWVYVDKSTFEVKFGVRASAEVGFKGPFDCTRQDRRLTLGGWEGFLAVKEGNFWAYEHAKLNLTVESQIQYKASAVFGQVVCIVPRALLYFDVLNDRLQSKVDEGIPVLEIELQRIEMRTPKPRMTQQQQPAEQRAESNAEPGKLSNGVSALSLDSPEVD